MATQNPIEQEGTYPLPEAQLDRFLMHVTVDYPSGEDELAILQLARKEASDELAKDQNRDQHETISQQDIFEARKEVLAIHMADNIEEYLLQIVLATRQPEKYGNDLARWIEWGGSPRATISLDRCARAHAWIAGRDYVGPEDVQAVAPDVLRHRIILDYEAEAEGMNADKVIDELIARIAVP